MLPLHWTFRVKQIPGLDEGKDSMHAYIFSRHLWFITLHVVSWNLYSRKWNHRDKHAEPLKTAFQCSKGSLYFFKKQCVATFMGPIAYSFPWINAFYNKPQKRTSSPLNRKLEIKHTGLPYAHVKIILAAILLSCFRIITDIFRDYAGLFYVIHFNFSWK